MIMQRWIDKVVQFVVEQYAPEQIVLFGSCAKGKQTLDSDVDLLIVKDTDLPRAYRGLEVVSYLKRFPVKFDLLFYTPSELECRMAAEYSFIHTIFKTGIILYKKH
jgi:uncharacterized protein